MSDLSSENRNGSSSYYARMLVIQRWRRITLATCVMLALYAGVVYLRDPSLDAASTGEVIASIFAFVVALLIAVNFLTIRFRK